MGLAFVMKHKANSMKMSTSKLNELWHVDSEASNHMTNHKEWFSTLEKPEQPGVVGKRGWHPSSHRRHQKRSAEPCRPERNVLHVSTITKNLVLVGKIVDQGMQVQFIHRGCFIEEEGKIIAQGSQEGRMFILETKEVRTTMFVREATPTSIPQRAKSKTEPTRFDPFGCMGTCIEHEHQRKPLLCNLHR